MKTLVRTTAMLATATLLLAATVVLYDELNAATAGNDLIATDGPLYESFSTGSTPASLTDVIAKLTTRNVPVTSASPNAHHGGAGQRPALRSGVTPAAVAGSGTTVGLYSDNATRPGVLISTLGTIADSALPTSGYANIDFPVNPPVPLSANTRYWIGFSATSGSPAALAWTSDTTGTGAATEFNVFRGTVFSNSQGPYQLRITAQTSSAPPPPSPTPVPPSILLGLTGLGIVFLYSTRRRLLGKA